LSSKFLKNKELANIMYPFSLDGHSAEINMTVLVSSLIMADIMHL
jgi:hypothetical protein